MRECLDEGTLQSYFDGELSTRAMESATLHLASCSICSAAARELEQETALLTSALAAEFEWSVPTESLRRRIEAAVAELNTPAPVIHEHRTPRFFTSFSSLFNFAPQRAFGYASLVVMLAFAAIFAVVKFREVTAPSPRAEQIANVAAPTAPAAVPSASNETVTVAPVVPVDDGGATRQKTVAFKPVKTHSVPNKPAPVKLIPGERSYLQTIARLDTTIKSEKRAMRPALQVEYERNLAVVDRAIAATRTAAKNNPNDPDAADFMFAAYQSKVDLLNTIADARLGDRSH